MELQIPSLPLLHPQQGDGGEGGGGGAGAADPFLPPPYPPRSSHPHSPPPLLHPQQGDGGEGGAGGLVLQIPSRPLLHPSIAFKRYKLLKLAMGEEKMPEEGDARDRWIEKSAVLYDLILQSVNNSMFQHIKDLVELDDSGPKAWKLLRDVIQPSTLPMVIVLEKELAALSMRPGDDVKPVLDKIKDTYARMAAAGSNVSQMQQCTKIISVLDNSWDNLIPTLNTQQDQWTPEWLRQLILQEDFRRRHTGGGAANKTAEGYGAAGGSRGRGGGRGRGPGASGTWRGGRGGKRSQGDETSATPSHPPPHSPHSSRCSRERRGGVAAAAAAEAHPPPPHTLSHSSMCSRERGGGVAAAAAAETHLPPPHTLSPHSSRCSRERGGGVVAAAAAETHLPPPHTLYPPSSPQTAATRYLTSQRQDGATLWAHASSALKAHLPPDPLPTDPESTPAAQADYDRRCFFRDHTTLTLLLAPVPVALADPSSGPAVARSSTTLPCPVVPSGVLRGLHIPSFTRNLVGVGYLQDRGITVTFVGGGRSGVCTDAVTGRVLATFTSGHVAVSPLVVASGHVAASCLCRSFTHQTVLWHHRLGHPSIPRLCTMASHRLVSGIPRGPKKERYFLVVVDDFSRYTTVFPLAKKSEVTSTLIWWLLSTEGTRGHHVSCLHSNRGGEFRSSIFAGFCGEQGIVQSSTLPESPQQNGVAERRIGLVMDIARTSMIHARAPHFLWPYAASPTCLWTGSPGVGSAFRVWGCLALVRDTSADKLSACTVPCIFLGFLVTLADCTLAPSLPLAPAPPVPPPPPGPAPSGVSHATPLPSVARQVASPSPQSSSRSPQQPSVLLRQVTLDSVGVGAGGAAIGGTRSGGARSRGAVVGGADAGGDSPGGTGAGGAGTGGASSEGAGAGGAGTGGASSGGGGAGGAGTGGANSGGAGVGGPGTGGARTRGAGAGDPDPVGTPSADTSSGGASSEVTGAGGTPPPHHHNMRYEAACQGVREEQERLERERQELRQLDLLEQQQQREPQQQPPQPQQLPLERQLFPPVGGLWALGLPSSPLVRSLSPPTFGPTFSPPDARLTIWSSPPPQSPPPIVPHYHSLLPSPPPSSLPVSPTPISDYYRAVCHVVSRVLATGVTDPRFSPSSVSALTAAVADFAAANRLDYCTRVVPAPPTRPLSVGGEFSIGCDVLEDRHPELEYLAAASPILCAMLLSPEGDPDALDIPTPCTYCEAVSGPWASEWKAAMDSELASWRSTGMYVDGIPPPRANVVDGMWLFKVKRPPGSPPVFKARYVVRGFSQREGVDFFQTFAPTPKMTTLRGRLNEEIWLRRPPGFTSTFPTGTQWSLRRPVYGLRQSSREWHDTLRSTLRDLGFRPSSADPSLFVCASSSPFFILVYVDDLVFATPDRAALAEVKSELQKRHTCTDLGPSAVRVPTPLAIDHKLTGPFPDEPFEPSGPHPDLVGCLMYLMNCTRPDLAYPISVLSRFVGPRRHCPVLWTAAVRVAKYLATTSRMGLMLRGTRPVELNGLCDSSYADDVETQRSTQGYCFSLGAGAVSWRSTRSSSASSSAEAKIYAGAMAAQELRWLTFLLADLGERPRTAPTLFAGNKAMILLCREPRLETKMKHIDVRYFLLRELQRRG
ncbi:unnamed protein product [Closterium sp. NIES-53]